MARNCQSGGEYTTGPPCGLADTGDVLAAHRDVLAAHRRRERRRERPAKGGTAMSDTQQRRSSTADGPYDVPVRREPTAWVGFVLFGGIMLVMMGSIEVIQGFVALFKDDYYMVTRSGLVLSWDYSAWGWTHLLIGLIAVGTGIGVMLGQMWARVVGIIIAIISALANLAFIAAYPIWATIVIATDVLVIYALAVHGSEVRDR
jgi:hypothetical protein